MLDIDLPVLMMGACADSWNCKLTFGSSSSSTAVLGFRSCCDQRPGRDTIDILSIKIGFLDAGSPSFCFISFLCVPDGFLDESNSLLFRRSDFVCPSLVHWGYAECGIQLRLFFLEKCHSHFMRVAVCSDLGTICWLVPILLSFLSPLPR